MLNLLGIPKAIVECVKNLGVLRRHVAFHPKLYITLTSLVMTILTVYWLTDRLVLDPARSVVIEYLDAVDRREYERAWSLLGTQYQTRWRGGIASFRAGYATTVAHKDINLKGEFWVWGLLRAWREEEMEFSISFRTIDRFTERDLSSPIQRINLLWLEIANPTRFRAMKDGSLGSEVASVELQRLYAQDVVVAHTREGWRIVSFHTQATTLPEQ